MVIRQNKKQFEKWYNDDFMIKMCVESLPVTLSGFYKLKFEMQIGVYLAYYDSLDGVKYIADYDVNEEKWFIWMVSKDRVRMIRDDNGKAMWFGTRKEAEIELLKKSNELRNEQLNK